MKASGWHLSVCLFFCLYVCALCSLKAHYEPPKDVGFIFHLFSMISQIPTVSDTRTSVCSLCSFEHLPQVTQGRLFYKSVCSLCFFEHLPYVTQGCMFCLSACSLFSLKDLLWTNQGRIMYLSVLSFCLFNMFSQIPTISVPRASFYPKYLFILYVLSNTYYKKPKDVRFVWLFFSMFSQRPTLNHPRTSIFFVCSLFSLKNLPWGS